MTYSIAFYRRTTDTARRSAARVVPRLIEALHPKSVLDVGAGGGAWLEAWSYAGVRDFCALDTAPPDLCGYALPANTFQQADLTRPFDLRRRFSVVQSLEVAEHLPPDSADEFIDSLCRHADIVLFSAAPPGQGGVQHLNEQPYGYWRKLFARRGYRPIDWVRRAVAGDPEVAWWYRYNMLLYVGAGGMSSLSSQLQTAIVSDAAAIEDVAPLSHRVRRLLLRPLPSRIVTGLARAAERARSSGQ